ncbi:MAG: twin-arginine translocase subunit TatC [Clostridiales bacterium]|nr:twin-arginine translocase subunit TatC [Clostridiales bacterium]
MENKMKTGTIVDHLGEFRKRLIKVAVINFAVAIFCFQYMETLIQYLLALNPGFQLIYITPSELFTVYILLAFVIALILCLPITIYEIWAFISQALYKKEKPYVFLTLVFGLGLFLLGVYFCYQVALPMTLRFFTQFSLYEVTAAISIKSFVSFCLTLLVGFGLSFELPVVIFLLSGLGVIKPEYLKKAHGVLILIIFIIAAIVTPPDVISQVILAVPMVILLEISILISHFVDKKRKKKDNLKDNT